MKKCIDKELGNCIVQLHKEGMSPLKISEKYNGSPCETTIRKYLKDVGEYKSRKFYGIYSYEECVEIAELYQKDEWDLILKKYPKLSKNSIYTICSKLHIRKDSYFWNKNDVEILINNYNKISLNELYNLLDKRHTEKAIQTKAKKMGLSNPKFWSDEENQILINNYSYVPKDKMLLLLPNRTWDAIILHANQFNLKSFYMINEKYSEEQKQFIRDNWETMSDQEIADVIGKTARGVMEQRNTMKLYRINKEYAKYENLAKLFRGHIQDWKNKSMELYGYKCIFTGSKNYAIHHIYGFNKILEEVFQEVEKIMPLISDNPGDYSKDELETMIKIFQEIHNKYPLGVCVRKDIHDLFHKIYGSGGNNEEQWDKFVFDFNNGLYDDNINY